MKLRAPLEVELQDVHFVMVNLKKLVSTNQARENTCVSPVKNRSLVRKIAPFFLEIFWCFAR